MLFFMKLVLEKFEVVKSSICPYASTLKFFNPSCIHRKNDFNESIIKSLQKLSLGHLCVSIKKLKQMYPHWNTF